ncbi:MAG: dTMP kinase [Gammaproteobacteria bacterium]|nr:dTMP kinase [Gammaproteobacteria bacterium]MCY4276424.1 dTMP kinase [Gammaproteobacteria bacterium]
MKGWFITLEGVEGVGKSTCIPHIASFLEERGKDVVTTREPGGTRVAEAIRELLLWSDAETLDPVAELLLHFASRRAHLVEVIEPAINRGKVVLCDRFTDATHAYQGGGSGISAAWIDTLSQIVHPKLEPDLTLLFDLAPEEGLKRIASHKADRYERESLAFLERVRNNYLERARASNRFVVIDASQRALEVRRRVLAAVETHFGTRA